MSVSALRQQLAAILPPPRAGDGVAIPTGIEALDRALSDGGVPSGRLTEIQGARGSGRTTLVRHLVQTAVEARRWVAVIDGSRTLAPREWAEAGDSGRLWMIRPHGTDKSAWCADILLRSGAFSLVVLDSPPPLSRQAAVRLTRLAKEHDVALVIVGDSPVIGSAVRLRVTRQRPEARSQRTKTLESRVTSHESRLDSRFTIHDSPVSAESRVTSHESRAVAEPRVTSHESRITIRIDKGGSQVVEVSCAIEMARRLRSHSEVPDRRGVATRNRRGEKIDSPHRRESGRRPATPDTPDAGHENERERDGGTLPRKRRFGEAYVRRDQFILENQRPEARGQRKRRRVTSHESRVTT
jgi:recA bacterial DNA recombination protein